MKAQIGHYNQVNHEWNKVNVVVNTHNAVMNMSADQLLKWSKALPTVLTKSGRVSLDENPTLWLKTMSHMNYTLVGVNILEDA